MIYWILVIALGVLTFAIRLSFIGLARRWEPSAQTQRALRFVAPAMLAALVVPELLRGGSAAGGVRASPQLPAAVLAALVAWRTRSMWLTLLVGMAGLWLLQAAGYG